MRRSDALSLAAVIIIAPTLHRYVAIGLCLLCVWAASRLRRRGL